MAPTTADIRLARVAQPQQHDVAAALRAAQAARQSGPDKGVIAPDALGQRVQIKRGIVEAAAIVAVRRQLDVVVDAVPDRAD